MKKLLLLSTALFCCYLTSWASVVDVTATYLQNYQKPFTGLTPAQYVNTGSNATRWQKVGAPWITENEVGTLPTIWELDNNKSNRICITPGWDGFATELQDIKVYQTVMLPAGKYAFYAYPDEDNIQSTYLAAASGVGIPTIANIATALGSQKYSSSIKTNFYCKFTLAAQTQVSLGVVLSSTGVYSAFTIDNFKLVTYTGGFYGELEYAVGIAQNYLSAASIGNSPGQFSQATYNALNTAVTNATNYETTYPEASDADIATQVSILNAAIATYTTSVNKPRVSTADSTYWYAFLDPRFKTNYMTSNGSLGNVKYTAVATPPTDAQLWKIVNNGTGYALVNKATGEYLNTDKSSGNQLPTQVAAPTTPLKFTLSPFNLDKVGQFWVENVSGTTNSLRLHAGSSYPMNWTGNANDNSFWVLREFYNVTYKVNGSTSGTAPADNGVYASGGSATVLGNTGTLAKTGYTFAGWNTKADGTGVSYTANATYTFVNQDLILYAKWTPITYTVTFNSQGGSNVSSQTVNSGATATKPTDPTLLGSNFGGWFTESACTNAYNFATSVTADITLYALWNSATGVNNPSSSIKVFSKDKQIFVLGIDPSIVKVFNISGQTINITKPVQAGIYLVKLGTLTTKVVVE